MTSNLRQFSWTDQGNALLMKELYGKELKFCSDKDVWFRWKGFRWEAVTKGEVRQLAIEAARRARTAWEIQEPSEERTKAIRYYLSCENRQRFVPTVETAAELKELRAGVEEFDRDIWLLGLENGQLDLRTLEFSEPRPESMITMTAKVKWVEGARAERWERFVREIFEGRDEVSEFVQRASGYTLTGSVEEQVMFICVGGGANGKSTFLNVQREILGDYAKAATFATFDAKARSEMTNDLARIRGARYVTIIESNEDGYLNEAKIKQVTGGDPITCRFLHKEFFEYVPQFKIWMAANRIPNVSGTDHGTGRRTIIVPFMRRFDGKEREDDLEGKLLAEREGILQWMVNGLRKWKEAGLRTEMPKEMVEAKAEYQADMDVLGKWLLARTVAEEGEIMATDLYKDYKRYVVEALGHRAKSITTWGVDMKERVPWRRISKGIVYQGLGLVDWDWDLGS